MRMVILAALLAFGMSTFTQAQNPASNKAFA